MPIPGRGMAHGSLPGTNRWVPYGPCAKPGCDARQCEPCTYFRNGEWLKCKTPHQGRPLRAGYVPRGRRGTP